MRKKNPLCDFFRPDPKQLKNFAWQDPGRKAAHHISDLVNSQRIVVLGNELQSRTQMPWLSYVHVNMCIWAKEPPPICYVGLGEALFSSLMEYLSTPSPSSSPYPGLCVHKEVVVFCSELLGSEGITRLCCIHLTFTQCNSVGKNSALETGVAFLPPSCTVAIIEQSLDF